MVDSKVIKTYDELKKICNEINSPWLNKHFKDFIYDVFWGVKGIKDTLPSAHDKLIRIQKILKTRGYDVDEVSLLDDISERISVIDIGELK